MRNKMHIASSIKEIKTLVSKHGVKLTPKDIKALRAIIASYALDAMHDSDIRQEVWKLADLLL
mgnify:CR=1 FL=1